MRVAWLDDLGVDDAALGLGEDLGLADLDARLRRDDADAGVAVGVHEAQRDDPVEPGVGDLVGDGSAALVATTRSGDRLLQRGDGLRPARLARRSPAPAPRRCAR